MGRKPNSDAALKAFLTNRVGDMGLLVGMIILFWSAGSWSIVDINVAAINNEIGQTTLLIASLCLTAAVMSKSGQFILHTWLPDAMAGPTPVSALIHAATMVVAGIYMVARLYGVFFEGYDIAGSSFNVLALVGSVTLVGAGYWLSSKMTSKSTRILNSLSARLHGHGSRSRSLDSCSIPPLYSRLLQSRPLPWSRIRKPLCSQLRYEKSMGVCENSCPQPTKRSSFAPSH
ncbi:MAG: hypothetical protein CM15mP49_19330 [Actinomycetota bacterium]|nr:MAG: hypothetical protein CM15mP49_19330 [Actinomycetota bacterium]